MDILETKTTDVELKAPLTLKEKIILQRKIDYVKQEIENYEMAVKVGKNPTFNAYNVNKISKLNTSLNELHSSTST
tara:strand:- start:6185 stop:6412 length:228 start_codon:yes stop_codon:yes gene_type:complete